MTSLAYAIFLSVAIAPSIVCAAFGPCVAVREPRAVLVIAIWVISIAFGIATLLGQNYPPTPPFYFVWAALAISAYDFVGVYRTQRKEKASELAERILDRKRAF